jgi:hypothetical protein
MSSRLRYKYRKFKSVGVKRKLKIAIEHKNKRQKNSLFKFLKKNQNDSNDTIVDSGQIESRINVNLQLSHSDDVNTEKVEVQSNSVSDEYEHVPTNNSGQIESQSKVKLTMCN